MPIKDWDVEIYRGVLTGYNEAFIINSEKRNEILDNCANDSERERTAAIIRPILRGRDIKRYGYDFADQYIIATFPSKHYNIDDYQSLKSYLLSFGMERLEQTGKEYVIDGERVKARKKTNNKWFETQDSISYWDELAMTKIIWIELSDESKFAMCDNYIPLNTVFFLTGSHLHHIIGQLNSKLIRWYFTNCIGTSSGVGTNRWLKYTVEQIPLIPYSDETLSQLVKDRIQTNDPLYEVLIDKEICSLYHLTKDEFEYINSVT